VPYPVESGLSGVGERVSAAEKLWYQREFKIPAEWRSQQILLNFEAVDWECIVWVNGREVGRHRGGYDPFTFDITAALTSAEKQKVLIAVSDPTEKGAQSRGNQMSMPDSVSHSPVTGIWQTVWLEPVPKAFIHSLKIEPDIENEQIQLVVVGTTAASMLSAKVSVFANDSLVTERIIHPNWKQRIPIPQPHLWHPKDPFLYQLKICLENNGQIVDTVTSYFGMRQIELGKTQDQVTRILLNQKFEFQYGILDAGYWPDGIYTAPTDAAIQHDILMLKNFGFNMLRKKGKIEPRRFYYWCDQLGVLVWQDMPGSGRLGRRSAQSAMQYEYELRQLLLSRFNHPSIVMWTPFSNGAGQIDMGRMVSFVHSIDSTRLINGTGSDGFCGFGDIRESRYFPEPGKLVLTDSTAAVVGAFGGVEMTVNGHMFRVKNDRVNAAISDSTVWFRQYQELLKSLPPLIPLGLSGAVYAQLTDGENSADGLVTCDRKVKKLAPAVVWRYSEKYIFEKTGQ
ncbi:glycoside hydrolase family 2, partial [bacterium]|nr:glycoside hydrolase family 2 [bacterium]